MQIFKKDKQYIKFCLYGFLKNLRFYDAFLLLFFLENEVSFSQIGILYAVREITTNITEIPSGIIADTFGRKYALIGAFGLYILAFLAFYFSTNFYLLLPAMLLVGVGDAFRSGTHKGMIMDYLRFNNWENQKVAYYGHTRSWSQRGSAISALLAGVMVYYSGSYRIVYLLSIVPYLLNFINIFSYPDEINFSKKGKSKERDSFKTVFQNFLNALRKKQVLKIMNSAALHSAFLKAIKDYIQPLMLNLAIFLPILATADVKKKSGLVIGICYFLIFLLTSIASQKAGKLADLKIKNIEMKTLLFGLTSGLMCGIFFYYEIWWLALILFIIIYIVENLRKPIMTGILADTVPNEILTSVISAQSFYQTLTTSFLAISLGFIADFRGIGLALGCVSLFLILVTLGLTVSSIKKAKVL